MKTTEIEILDWYYVYRADGTYTWIWLDEKLDTDKVLDKSKRYYLIKRAEDEKPTSK